MGISGFEPTFLVGLEAVREERGPGLAALGGRRLAGFAIVRFVEDRDWFTDCPVVLDFDGVQAEIWGRGHIRPRILVSDTDLLDAPCSRKC